jgi:hypothetical protein
MTGQQGAWNKIKSGDMSGAWGDIVTWATSRIDGGEKQFPALATLIARLTTDEGVAAEQVAQDAWNAWEDNTPLLTVAENAVKEAASKGVTVLVDDVADWLGIIDRNTPNASSAVPTDTAAPASPPPAG